MGRRAKQRQNTPPEFFFGEHSKIFPMLVARYDSGLVVMSQNLKNFGNVFRCQYLKLNILLPGLVKSDFQSFLEIFTDFGRNVMLSICVVLYVSSS
jgi:hypothetical protein